MNYSHIATPVVKYLALTLGLILFIFTILSFWNARLGTLDIGRNMVIKENGGIYQGSTKVGQLRPDKNNQLSAQIPVPVPGDDGTTVNFFITFEGAYSAAVQVKPISIQSTGSMEIVPVAGDSSNLHVFLPNLLQDGHTALRVTADPSAFHISPLTRLVAWISNWPSQVWILGSIILVGIAALSLYLAKPRIRLTATTEIQPDVLRGITPLETAIFMHSKLTAQDLAAVIFDLANRGYLQIIHRELQGEILLFRTTDEKDLQAYESEILDIIAPKMNQANTLSRAMANLDRNLFSKAISLLYVTIYDSFVTRGYVYVNPRIAHLRYKTIGIGIQLLALLTALFGYFTLATAMPYLTMIGGALYIVGICVYKTGYQMLDLTPSGEVVSRALLAFKQYLSMPKFMTTLEAEQGEVLYRFLPYATAFGVKDAWLARFSRTRCLVPKWFTTEGEIYEAQVFAALVDQITQQVSSLLVKVKDPNVD